MQSIFSITWYTSCTKGSSITNLALALFFCELCTSTACDLCLHLNLVRTCAYTCLYSHSYRMFCLTGTEWNFNVSHIYLHDFSLCNSHFNYLMHPNTYLKLNLIVILVLKWEQDWQNKLKTNFYLWLLCDVTNQASSLALKDVEVLTSAYCSLNTIK